MANAGLTENEMFEQIAYQITKNQIYFDSKSEEEKKELMPKVDAVAESQMGELRKSFNSVLSSVQTTITPEARLIALQSVTDKVISQEISSVEMVFSSNEIVNMVTAIAVIESSRNREENTSGENTQIYEAYALGEVLSVGDKGNLTEKERVAYEAGEELEEDREKAAKDITERANNAETPEIVKEASVALSYLPKFDVLIKGGIKFDDLRENDRIEFIAAVRCLVNDENKPELAKKYMQNMGLTVEEINKKEYDGVIFEFDFKDGKQTDPDTIINNLSAKLQALIDYSDKIPSKVFEMEFKKIIEECKKSPYGVDAIFRMFTSDCNSRDINEAKYQKVIQLALDMAKDPQYGTIFDKDLAEMMEETARKLHNSDNTEMRQEIIDLLNSKDIEGFQKIDINSFIKVDKNRSSERVVTATEESKKQIFETTRIF